MVGSHVASHIDAVLAGLLDQVEALGGRQAGDVQPRAGLAGEAQVGEQRDDLGAGRDAGQTQARGDFAIVGDTAPGEIGVEGLQPDAEAEGGGWARWPG
jgi:hypothetical protein